MYSKRNKFSIITILFLVTASLGVVADLYNIFDFFKSTDAIVNTQSQSVNNVYNLTNDNKIEIDEIVSRFHGMGSRKDIVQIEVHHKDRNVAEYIRDYILSTYTGLYGRDVAVKLRDTPVPKFKLEFKDRRY